MAKLNVEKIYRLTPMQEGILYHKLLNESSTEYVMQSSFQHKGKLNIELMRQSLSLLAIKHEVLRTFFKITNGVSLQAILRNRQIELNEKCAQDAADLESIKKTDITRGFDLKDDSLLRVSVIRKNDEESIILWTMHHIIADGWCMSALYGDFINTYYKLLNGTDYKVLMLEAEREKEISGSFQDYIHILEQKNEEAGLQYWERLLEGYNETATIVPIVPIVPMQAEETSNEVEQLDLEIDRGLSKKLQAFTQKEKITINNITEVALGIVLQKYNRTNDVVFGKVVSGRDVPIKGIDRIVGLFINTVPLRVQNDQNAKIIDLLHSVHQQGVESSEYDYCSLVDIQGRSELGRYLFSTILVYENYYVDESIFDEANLQQLGDSIVPQGGRGQTNYGIYIRAHYSEGLNLDVIYDPRVYGKIDAEFLLRRIEAVILDIVVNPDKRIVDIDLVSDVEREMLLYKFNDTHVDYPSEKTIHQLFEEQAVRTPDNVALVFNDGSMTYSELNARSNQLARVLRGNRIKPDSIVGVMLERSFEMIIAILGILKAGGAYLPVDPQYPEGRIKFMLEDSEANILLTQSWLRDRVRFEGDIIELDDPGIYKGVASNLETINCANNLVYVMYTSGSTGKPKGVLVEHRSVVNFIVEQINIFKINPQDHVLQSTSISFDPSMEQIYTALLSGASLYLVDNGILLDSDKLNIFMRKNTISHVKDLPSFIERVNIDELDSLKRVAVAGEVCPISLATKMSKKLEFYNLYGPTETTLNATVYKVNPEHIITRSVPIGRPRKNYKVYILNSDNKLSPFGVPGEICISGYGLARGYLNRPELTAEKFVTNLLIPGERMYRTGDLGWWLPDGNIEFLGRIDHQVKIRGCRVELGEIENIILELEMIKKAVVLVQEDKSGENYLCAYVVSDGELLVKDLREFLRKSLPNYMIPTYFIQLDKLPLNSNGKVDRKALLTQDVSMGTGVEYEAPRNEREEILAKIWHEILNIEKVGIHDNFFGLGGHSLKGIILISRIHKELNVELPLKELFEVPTIAGLSEYLDKAKPSAYASIEAAKEKEYYAVSSAQKRMYVLQQLDPYVMSYNIPMVMTVDGVIEKEKFEAAIFKLIERHEVLRTSFATIEDQVVQRIHKGVVFSLEYAEKADEYEKNEDELINDAVKSFIRPFDLAKAPMLHVGLIKLAEEKHLLLFDVHHIISDGTTMPVLTREFAELYADKELKGQRIQYKDFSEWQNAYLKSDAMEEQERYWLERLSGELPVLRMPLDYPRPVIKEFDGQSIELQLGKELSTKLKSITKESGATLYMVLLSAVNILLSKYTEQEDIIIGSPIAGRPHADLENMLGMFVNTLVMRNYPESSKSYVEFLSEVKENALKAYENQDYQFEELIERLDLLRDMSRNPLFDVMFVLQNADVSVLELEGLRFTGREVNLKIAKFDLTFMAVEEREDIWIRIEYNTSLFNKDTIEQLGKHLYNLLIAITNDREVQLGAIDILSTKERNQLLYEFNDTYSDYPREKTIYQLFEEQAERTPDNVALVYKDKEMTYRELNAKSNQLARILRSKGVKPDDLVGIMVERSFEMIIGILGILKAGGAYLPIDPEYPKGRIKFMLEDSGVDILLIQTWLDSKVVFDGDILELDDPFIYEGTDTKLELKSGVNNLAYVIYTSGSTGVPKGTMIEHRNVVRLLFNKRNLFEFTEEDVWTMFHSFCFDFSVWEMYGSLLYGGKLIIIDRDMTKDVNKFINLLVDQKVTILNQTPAAFYQFMREEEQSAIKDFALKQIIFGGDKLKPELLCDFQKRYPLVELINMYGITETTVHVTYKKLYGDDLNKGVSNIGVPIPTLSIYIVDKNKALCGINIPGELCVSGKGLARGYLNRPELTAEKFVENPFVPGERMYLTGDLARWLPDGNIEFLGRIDEQVKIRGFRIELGEIESRLLKIDFVKESVVLAHENGSGDKYLCAYVVAEEELSVKKLREGLAESLPDYMIPSYFVQLTALPLTSNGKVDRKNLPALEGKLVSGTEYLAPRTKTEEDLAKIWSDVLGIEKVGIHDNFFELGGHSLKGMVLASRIQKELDIELPIKELFKSPTILGLGEYLDKAKPTVYALIEPAEEKEFYEVSSAQKRMFVLQQLDPDGIGYNMPTVMMVEGILKKEKLETALCKLIERHEALRTSFEAIEGKIVQCIHKDIKFELKCSEETKGGVEEVIKGFIRPFNLGQAPLLRVMLIKLTEDEHFLLFDMHHIIFDGVSMSILIKELGELYGGKELKKQKIQYKDFSEWQNTYQRSGVMKEQEKYWLEIFADEVPVLNMPLDYTRPAIQEFSGDNVGFQLGKELSGKIRIITKETGATLYMILLSAITILLSKYSGQEDIIIGSLTTGRPHADLENIIGVFINTLAMRNYPESGKSYENFLSEVKENALKAYENQDYQIEELIDNLGLHRDINRSPLFDVMFLLQNMEASELVLENLKFKNYGAREGNAKYDLTFTVVEVGDDILIDIGYCTSLFKKKTIERMAGHFSNLLKVIMEDRSVLLKEIDILSDEERNKLLYAFNDNYAEYPWEKTIQQCFEGQVKRAPDNVALVFKGESMRYAELNARANQLAWVLRDMGVKADSIVGIMAESSIDRIIGILGILKAGGAYLPIDPEYPAERIGFMLKDSGANILLTQSVFKGKITFEKDILELDKGAIFAGKNTSNLEHASQSNDLAYVMYTSGSTGKPKGVLIEHRSVINFCLGQINRLKFNEYDRALQFLSISFDMSVEQIFTTILSGASLYLIDKDVFLDQSKFIKFMRDNAITYLYTVPSHLNSFSLDGLDCLKRIVCGGEVCASSLVKRLIQGKDCEFYNSYGPTEATVISTMSLIKMEDIGMSVPIGKPIHNYQVYILNKDNHLSPIGVAGELCVAGRGLARGYLNRPELTLEKFGENPFIQGERMYRTGDLARWLPDGNIEFLGRIDHQVKIRGFRIELAEIESRLLDIEEVKEAVVLAREDGSGDKYLCAYVAAKEEILAKELQEQLAQSLPDYMVPPYIVQLPAMPLTPNGKVDKKALPMPDSHMKAKAEYEAPRNEFEEVLVRVWSEVLGVEKVGIRDNFFDLGGHSLKGTVLISRIHKELDVELPLMELFKAPTIAGNSEYLSNAKPSPYASIEVAKEKEYYEVSSAQKRMFMLLQLDPGGTSYNIPMVLTVDGVLEIEQMEIAVRKLIERHEVLRTSFEAIEDLIIQRIYKDVGFAIEHADKTEEYTGNGKECIEEAVRSFIRPFDLSKAPLLRVRLIKLTKERHLLLFDTHHIISDGISMSIMIREFTELYAGKKLKTQRIQYKDFSEWQNAYLKSKKMEEQKKYWLDRFSDEIPVLGMQYDYPRPAMQESSGGLVKLKLGTELGVKLRRISKETSATLYMILLSAVNILLAKYTGQDDIVIGSPIAGRQHADLENILGMFVNTLAMRNYPASDKTYAKFLSEVMDNALKAYENQDYQFEELVDKLDLHRDMSRNPLFDVMFVLQNMETANLEIEGLKFTGYEPDEREAKFDLTFIAMEEEDSIQLSIEYCIGLFEKETIERLGVHLSNLLGVITDNRNILLGEIDILTEKERNKLLSEFNDTYVEYPRGKTIHKLFEEQVDQTPDKVALVFEDETMSYGELNARANQIARILRDKGIKPDETVGIMVENSFEMIIGILGILKAGGAYLPINSEYPEERVNFMLEDSETNILLTQSWLRGSINFAKDIVELDDSAVYVGDDSDLAPVNQANDLAYVIYTSGSTGNPKGVMVEHRSLVNLCLSQIKRLKMNKLDRVLQFSKISFDASIEQIFMAILCGASLCLIGKDILLNHSKFREFLQKNAITHFESVPSFLSNMNLDGLNHLKRVVTGGEICTTGMIEKLKLNGNCEFYNFYGPTEATVTSSIYLVKQGETRTRVPIGKPVSNVSFYVIDKNENIQPIGIPGELCISGEGLARGYLNRPELTAEKFVDNPFIAGERMYRTGDLVRWLPDGNIEFFSRIDNQVKIRAFRVELGEIEKRLLEIEVVKEAVVLAREDESGDKYLCAYIVAQEELSVKELRGCLARRLPDYMIPSYFVQLKGFPLTSSGKIDRKVLPAPKETMIRGTKYAEPRNQLERDLLAIWESVLSVTQLGIYDDFFEMGGNSLKVVLLANKINRELQVTIPLIKLYASPNVAHIAEYIADAKPREFENNDGVVLFKKGKQINKNFFFVPSFTGRPEVYRQLVNDMDDTFSYWGLVHEKLNSYSPCLPTVEELAANYIEKIKKIQKNGPYYISGWSLGGIIVFEIARQLVKINEEVKFVGIFDSPALKKQPSLLSAFKAENSGFTIQTEFRMIEKIFPDYNFREKYKEIRSVEDLWNRLAEDLEDMPDCTEVKEKAYFKICSIFPDIEQAIKDSAQVSIKYMLLYFNLIRGYWDNIDRLYSPHETLNAKISYFIASRDPKGMLNGFSANRDRKHSIRSWSEYSSKKTDFYDVDADHFSMIENEKDVKKLAASLTSAIRYL